MSFESELVRPLPAGTWRMNNILIGKRKGLPSFEYGG